MSDGSRGDPTAWIKVYERQPSTHAKTFVMDGEW